MGFKARKAREPDYQPTPREVALEQQNEATRQRLRAFIAEQEALMPSPRPTPEEIAAELRTVIAGQSLVTVSGEAQVLVINLQGSLMTDKKARQKHWRQREKHYSQLAKALQKHQQELIEMDAELWKIEPAEAKKGIVRERIWAYLRRTERIATEEAEKARTVYSGKDLQRIRALQAIKDVGLTYKEIADLVKATDGVNWHTGEREPTPSKFLRRYLDPEVLPDRCWAEDDGCGKLIDTIKGYLKPSRSQ